VGTPWSMYDAITGMAHGIAGPLALLATAHTAGWSVAGQRTAIQGAAHWLLHWRTNATPRWPPYVIGDALDNDTAQPTAGRRDAWCYGAPGIGRALTLAGRALADPRLTEAGDTAIASLAERPAELWDVEGPTLCHGHAGVLQSAATNQGTTADRAAAAVTEAFNPRLAFAFPPAARSAGCPVPARPASICPGHDTHSCVRPRPSAHRGVAA
jgi:class I lanthipeptide synthase